MNHRAALADGVGRRLRRALNDALASLGDQAATAPPLLIARAAAPSAPAQLAAAHPGDADERQRVAALYERCLTLYRRQLLRAGDAAGQVDNVGAALAQFVAANLEAVHGVRATAAMLLRLEHQLSGIVRSTTGWSRADTAERQGYFERLAILSMLIAESSAQAAWQGPQAVDNVQRAARGYLQQLLGLDADELLLDAGGLALRAPNAADTAPA